MSEPKKFKRWPLFFIALPASVAVWSGWVGLGAMCGFGVIHPLPGIWDSFKLNTAITLPVGVEAYGAYAMGAWLTPGMADRVKRFAMRSGIGSLVFGMLGQVVYHLLNAAHVRVAPWFVIMLVSCLPVVALGLGAALMHLLRNEAESPAAVPSVAPSHSPLFIPDEPPTALIEPYRATQVNEAKPEPARPEVSMNSHRKRARHAPGAPTIDAVESSFAQEISRGEIPKVATIMKRMQVGRVKAESYQAHIAERGRAVRDARAAA